MTTKVFHLEADSVANSVTLKDNSPEEPSLSTDTYWAALLAYGSEVRRKQVELRFRAAMTETSTVGGLGQIEEKMLSGFAHSSLQSMPMALSSYAAACDFLASAMQEDLLELLGSWADVGTSFGQGVTNIAQAFCSVEYLSQVKHKQVASSKPAPKEILDFLSERVSGVSPDQILDEIGELAQESFPDIVHYSFNIVEDPEMPNEERICLEIHSRGTVEAVSLQYDSFIDCLIETFPFEVRHWFVVDINLV